MQVGIICHRFDIRRVEFLDHLDVSTVIFSNLVNVNTPHELHTNVSMAEAVGCARLFIVVAFELCLVQYVVE
jgi:hypothetical protein